MKALFLFLFAAILGWQLFLPGFIGMANNGDFAKVAGPLCIEGEDHQADNFLFFQAHYLRGPMHCYNPRVPTSELALAWLSSKIQQAFGDPAHFDIRWLGGLHALLYLGFYWCVVILLRPLHRMDQLMLLAVALWMFADVSVVTQLNSFYTDVAAILGGLTATLLALHLIKADRVRLGLLTLFAMSALLFITSKAQHGIFGLIPAGLALALTWRSPARRVRWAGYLVTAVLLVGMTWILTATPDWYKAQARFNLTFSKIAKNSRTPLQDLVELGLNEGDLRYIGMHSFMPDSPMNDPEWAKSFLQRSTYRRVLKFYLHHPMRAVMILWSDLQDQAWQRRPLNLSNYQRESGMPAGATTSRFGTWSALRTWLFRLWAPHILLWFGAVLTLSPWLALRSKSHFQRSVAWTLFTIALLAAGEFCFASLADASETYRHLLLFHVFTDLTIFLALLLPARVRQR